MPEFSEELAVFLALKTRQFNAGLKKAGRGLSDFGARAKKASGGLANVGKKAAVAGASLAGMGLLAFKNFSKFEKKFAEVTTLFKGSESQIATLRKGIKRLSREFGVDVVEATSAAYQAISAGVKPAETIEFLADAFKLAQGGATDAFTATDALTTVLNSYGLEAKDAGAISDILFATIKAGKTTAGELGRSLGDVATTAATAGVSFAQVGAALATMTKSGLATTKATTSLRQIILGILNPSDQAAEALAKIGVSAASLREEGLVETMKKIGKATGGSAEKLTELFTSVEAFTGAVVLSGNNLEEFIRIQGETSSATGATEAAVKKMGETSDLAFRQMKESLNILVIELGEGLAPAVSSAAKGIADFIGKFPSLSKFTVIATASLVALKLAGVSLFGVLAVLIAKIGGAGLAILTFKTGLAALILTIAGPAALIASTVALGVAIGVIGFKIGQFLGKVTGLTEGLSDLASQFGFVRSLFGFAEEIDEAALRRGATGRRIRAGLTTTPEERAAAEALIATGVGGEEEGRQFGGLVRGRGVGDRVRARLSPGEFVLRQQAAQALGPAVLQALNQAGGTNINQTFNFQMGGGGDLREQARALMPEFERATRRGIGGVSFA